MLFEQIVAIQDPAPHTAALNMAIDEALLRAARVPLLRVYGWSQPTLSLGYFSRFAEAKAAAAGRALVRRWTGGGLVEHGEDITYSLIVPREAAFFSAPPAQSYRQIHENVAVWLRHAGMKAQVVVEGSGTRSGVCFTGHVPFDIVGDKGKVAGAAQRRTRWGLLHQGSVRVPQGLSLAGESLADTLAGRVQLTQIASGIRAAAHQIAEERYATEGWLQKF